MCSKRVKIVYYSGTGGTERVAEYFEAAFKDIGHEVCMQPLSKNVKLEEVKYETLLLLYAVHAFNAPEAVYKWIESLENVNDIPAIVISVSGGGEVFPNTACRVSSIKKLQRKGYKVIYEKMLVMPSNWIVSTKTPLAKMLLEVLPQKVKIIVEDIEKGVIRRKKPHIIDRVFSCVGELEKLGAKVFGKRIKLNETCNACGWCVRNCPAGNITMESNKPKFGNKCHLCLKCIYGCPSKALEPGIGKFIVIKEGYDLKALEEMQSLKQAVDIEKQAKGYIWSGVKKYLLEDRS